LKKIKGGAAVLMGDWRGAKGFWWEILRERDHLEDLGID
jgi:hypothetical protein